MMVVEEIRIVLEDGARVRLLHVHLHTQQTLFSHLVQKLIHHFERVQVALLAEFRPADDLLEPDDNLLENVRRISRQQCARGRAGNDQQFGRLEEHQDLAFLHEKAADHRCKDQENAYDGKHGCPPGANVMWLPPAWMLDTMASCARSRSCANDSAGAA